MQARKLSVAFLMTKIEVEDATAILIFFSRPSHPLEAFDGRGVRAAAVTASTGTRSRVKNFTESPS
jgi:hypothetical protein